MLARFDIVLVAFPFTDGPNVKPRPAMVICLSERHQKVSSRCRLSRMTTLAMPLVRRRIGSLPEVPVISLAGSWVPSCRAEGLVLARTP